MSITLINPSTLYDGSPHGLSHATVDTETGYIFVSGQVDWDTDYQLKHDNIELQTEHAMQNLATVLEAANSSISNILHLQIYVRGEVSEHIEKIAPIMVRNLNGHRPAITGIGVKSLASPETLIEIGATAKVIT